MNRFFASSYLVWEILPASNAEFIRSCFDHLEYLENNEVNTWKHRDTSDYYFSQRPVGGVRPFPFAGLGIPEAAFTELLKEGGLSEAETMEFVDEDEADDPEMKAARCFVNPSYAIFFRATGQTVAAVWFDFDEHSSSITDRQAIERLLLQLGVRYGLLLVDWYEKEIIDLSEPAKLAPFLDRLPHPGAS